MSKAPVIREQFVWAESDDSEVITEAKMIQAVSSRLTFEPALSVNAQLWNLLAYGNSGLLKHAEKGVITISEFRVIKTCRKMSNNYQ